MKTEEELNALKDEVETLNKKLAELTVEELTQVPGGGENDGETKMKWGCNTPGCRLNYISMHCPDDQYDICPYCGAKCQWWEVYWL